jgi:hypothetical protein
MIRMHRLIAAAVLVTGACDLDITNPNSPVPIGPNPTRAEVAAAATGILIAARSDLADWVLDAGIIGREAYRFDGSDPRFLSEFLVGPLDPGSGAFGGDHWFEHYRTIRSAHNLIDAVVTADPQQVSAAEQAAVRGFAETFQAWSFLIVLSAHTQDSIPLDVNQPVGAPPAPYVTNDSAYAYVSALLDSAQAHLAAGGAAFPFDLPSGFAIAATPAGFLEFNRALKARVEVYRGSLGCGATCYNAALTALAASFLDAGGAMGLGVYMDFGTGPGDNANVLAQDPQTSDNLVHPSLDSLAETQVGGGLDARLLAKTVTRPPRTSTGLTSGRSFVSYPTPSSPIPLIRNEELLLLRAEALAATGAGATAATDVNLVRTTSGNLAAIANLGAQSADSILTVILHERQYSLLYEGGHRWVDLRRTGRLAQIPVDRVGDVVHPTLPVPSDECLARVTDPAQCSAP